MRPHSPRGVFSHMVYGPSPIMIQATDYVDPQTPCYRYEIAGYQPGTNPSNDFSMPQYKTSIVFHHQDTATFGIPNGVSPRAVLAVVQDHLETFQNGSNRDYSIDAALNHIRSAIMELSNRANRIGEMV